MDMEPGSIRITIFRSKRSESRFKSVNRSLGTSEESLPPMQPTVTPQDLFSWKSENRHAVQLARDLRSGSHRNHGIDRHCCRSSPHRRSQSRAAVHLHRRVRGFDQRPCLRHGQRRHCGGGLRAVVSHGSSSLSLRRFSKQKTLVRPGGDEGRRGGIVGISPRAYRSAHRELTVGR